MHRKGSAQKFSLKGIMEANAAATPVNGNVTENVWQTFNTCFSQVQNILDQNRILINEINQNQESNLPDHLTRNVALIQKLNSNITQVAGLYGNLSTELANSMEPFSEKGTVRDTRSSLSLGQRRIRSP